MKELKEILAKKTLNEEDLVIINANRHLLTKSDLKRLGYDEPKENE